MEYKKYCAGRQYCLRNQRQWPHTGAHLRKWKIGWQREKELIAFQRTKHAHCFFFV